MHGPAGPRVSFCKRPGACNRPSLNVKSFGCEQSEFHADESIGPDDKQGPEGVLRLQALVKGKRRPALWEGQTPRSPSNQRQAYQHSYSVKTHTETSQLTCNLVHDHRIRGQPSMLAAVRRLSYVGFRLIGLLI